MKKLKSILTANNPKTVSTANWSRALYNNLGNATDELQLFVEVA